jgi:hypothetical protein
MFVEYTGKASIAPALALLTAGVRAQLNEKYYVLCTLYQWKIYSGAVDINGRYIQGPWNRALFSGLKCPI